jgi:hypothetical protein
MNTLGRLILLCTSSALWVSSLVNPAQSQNQEKPLYTAETTCLWRGKVDKCKVVATDTPDATTYRMTVANQEAMTVRLGDRPLLRAQVWNQSNQSWEGLRQLTVLIPEQVVCFNGQLCVHNPNFVNSLLREKPGHRISKKMIRSRFDPQGEILAVCFDEGCTAPL